MWDVPTFWKKDPKIFAFLTQQNFPRNTKKGRDWENATEHLQCLLDKRKIPICIVLTMKFNCILYI